MRSPKKRMRTDEYAIHGLFFIVDILGVNIQSIKYMQQIRAQVVSRSTGKPSEWILMLLLLIPSYPIFQTNRTIQVSDMVQVDTPRLPAMNGQILKVDPLRISGASIPAADPTIPLAPGRG